MRSENWVYHFHTLSIFWVWEMSLGHLSGFAAGEAAAGVLFVSFMWQVDRMVRGSLYLVSLEAAMWVLDGDGTGVISEHLGTIVNYVHLF